MDTRAKELIKQGDAMFAKRGGLMVLWQTLAENFKPERADFTASIADAALVEHLFTSYPVLAARELTNIFAAMLRPRSSRWLSMHASDKALDTVAANREYMEYSDEVMWRAMYDPDARFVRATKECDGDYVVFGQGVIQVEVDMENMSLIYRCHHLRDTAWTDNAKGISDYLQRKDRLSARQLDYLFGDKCSVEVKRALHLDPETEFQIRHVVVPERIYKPDAQAYNKKKFPYCSVWVEVESETVLEELPRRRFGYVIPRWQTVSGSQYARSPATEPSLPDARTMQIVIRTLREAGEKHVDPPRVTPMEPLRSDIFLQAGGVTYYDAEYDEKSGEILRPIDSNPGTMPIGNEIALALREDIRNGMFLDKINLPQADLSKMPVYTVRRVLEEQIRAQAPLFEPIEQEYSAPLCNETFELLREVGSFGDPEMIPEGLRDQQIDFTFQSPLRDIADSQKTQQFVDGMGVVRQAMEFDPAQLANVKMTVATRSALKGLGWSQDWFEDEEAVAAAKKQMQEAANMQRGVDALQRGAEIADTTGSAVKQLEPQT